MSFQSSGAVQKRNYNLRLGPSTPPVLVALLHFDGADASTVFTDSSPANRTYARTGTPTITTSQGVFAQSGTFDGNDDVVSASIPRDQSLGLEWTIEGRVRLGRTSNNYFFFLVKSVLDAGATIWIGANVNATDRISAYVGGSYLDALAVAAIDQWYAVAVVQTLTTKYLFIDGVLQASQTTNLKTQGTGPDLVGIGGAPLGGYAATNQYHLGFMDEWRLSRQALYTANYVVSPTPFPPP